jgi:prephenate dehydrogenase
MWGRRQAAVEEIHALGMAHVASNELEPVVSDADIIVFCVPIGVMPVLARQILPWVKPGALITDVGSAKNCVVEALAPLFVERARFIGSHPMAGSEQSGLSAAKADLFEGAVCILTPHAGVSEQTLQEAQALWELVGCRIRTMPPGEHDEVISLVSHLPHLLAAVLVDFVCAENPNSVNFCGNGFRDTTRVASGPPDMWTEIIACNREALSQQLDGLIARLQEASRLLAARNDVKMNELLLNAKIQRDRLKRGN